MVDNNKNFVEHEVRLFPSVHITSEREAELRATASLLAMIPAVSEFGRSIVRRAGGLPGRLSCFTEIPHQLDQGDQKKPEDLRPDGLIRSIRGKKQWVALVEVKVGKTPLDQEQVDKYHRLARQEGYNALITVSNQTALPGDRPPVSLDGRKLRSTPVIHFSWERLLSEAQMLSRKKTVSDPDQKWMLDEWIRYVDDPDSKILEPPELGPAWNDVLKAAKTSGLAEVVSELEDVVNHWIGYLRKAAFRLRAKLGVEVRPRLTRADKADHRVHVNRLISEAITHNSLSGALKIPDAAGDLTVEVFLNSRTVRYGVEVYAPTEGRQLTRVRWFARQLRSMHDLPSSLQVTVDWSSRNLISCGLASQLADDASTFLVNRQGVPIPKDVMPRRFLIHWTTSLYRGRGRSTAPVLEGVSRGLEDFYRSVVERLMPYVPPAPRLPKSDVETNDAEQTPKDKKGSLDESEDNQNTAANQLLERTEEAVSSKLSR